MCSRIYYAAGGAMCTGLSPQRAPFLWDKKEDATVKITNSL